MDTLATARSAPSVPDVPLPADVEFAQIYEECAQSVFRYLLGRVGGADLAEELTAQTFVAALQAFASYRGSGTHLAWLIRIARRKAVDDHRRRARERPLDDAVELAEADAQSPHQIVVARLEQERVIGALQRLTPDRRDAATLRIFAGLTAREAGEVMGKSEAPVKMLVHRGLRDLRTHLLEESKHA